MVEDNTDHQLLIDYCLQAGIPQAESVFVSMVEDALSCLAECVIEKKPFPKSVILSINYPPPESAWYLLKEFRKRYPYLPVLVLGERANPVDVR